MVMHGGEISEATEKPKHTVITGSPSRALGSAQHPGAGACVRTASTYTGSGGGFQLGRDGGRFLLAAKSKRLRDVRVAGV